MRIQLHTATCALAIGMGVMALSGAPVMAQTMVANTRATNAGVNNTDSKAPSGSLEKFHGMLRASELDGANVYNDQGNVIGTVNDMLVGDDGKVQTVVISVGGFLGVGTHYVSVPFSQLQVEASRSHSTDVVNPHGTLPVMGNGTASAGAPGTAPGTTAGAGANATAPVAAGTATDNSVNGNSVTGNRAGSQYFSLVLPGATKDSLTKMPQFRYTS